MNSVRLTRRALRTAAILAVVLVPIACQQRMAKQPSYRPLTQTEFWDDHRSSRPLEEGVVHRAQSLDDDPLVSGLSADGKQPQSIEILDEAGKRLAMKTGPGIPNKVENFVTAYPFSLTEADLKRGKERYTIYCTPCHGVLGDGKGKIWERGFLAPPNYHTDNSRGFGFYNLKLPIREVPAGYIFEVITKGYGGMPDHASQIPAVDRWRIVAYVRALQLSQNADRMKLTPAQWAEIENGLGGQK